MHMDEQVFSNEDTGVIVVDVQADFTELKSGSLAVPGTDAGYIETVQTATSRFFEQGLPIYFTQDWHPVDHVSFFTNNPGTEPYQEIEIETGRIQVMWPPHCVQNTPGAEMLIHVKKPSSIVQTGSNSKFDSYSGFVDDGGNETDLASHLQRDGIKNLIVFGLATDYCVKATAIDAVDAGYKVTVIEGLSKGVAPETTAQALKEMKAKGIIIEADLDM
jgi:nicotinamidase/pyrazinamidase